MEDTTEWSKESCRAFVSASFGVGVQVACIVSRERHWKGRKKVAYFPINILIIGTERFHIQFVGAKIVASLIHSLHSPLLGRRPAGAITLLNMMYMLHVSLPFPFSLSYSFVFPSQY